MSILPARLFSREIPGGLSSNTDHGPGDSRAGLGAYQDVVSLRGSSPVAVIWCLWTTTTPTWNARVGLSRKTIVAAVTGTNSPPGRSSTSRADAGVLLRGVWILPRTSK